MNRFTDIISTRSAKRVIDANGFAHVPAIITRVGIQQYTKDQLGIPGESGSELVNVFRGPDTVFHPDTIESFRHLPVTDTHPPVGVSPQNAKLVQGGHTGEDVAKMSDEDLGVTIHLTDEVFIYKSKGSETSAGYDATIIRDSGEYNGQKYEYRFDGAMIGNHLALVDKARCGSQCRVLDEEHNKEKQMDEAKVQTMIDASNEKLTAVLTKQFGDTLAQTLKTHQDEQDKKAEEKAKADEDAKKKADEEAKQKKADAAAIRASIEMRHKIKPLLGDKFDDSKSDHELLVLCFDGKIEDAKNKSDEYLTACLDQELAQREKHTTPPGKNDAAIPVGGVRVKAI